MKKSRGYTWRRDPGGLRNPFAGALRALLWLLIAAIAVAPSAVQAAGWFWQQPAPTGGWPNSHSFTFIGIADNVTGNGTSKLSEFDNVSANKGTFTNVYGNGAGDLLNYRDAYINRNIIGGGAGISGFATFVFDDNNVRIGAAGNGTGTGLNNFFAGHTAGEAFTTGQGLVAIGRYTLKSNTSGNWNIAIGDNALSSNTTAQYNIAIGLNALASNDNTYNMGIGAYALEANTTGAENVGVGAVALRRNKTGAMNSAFGNDSLAFSTTASGNTGAGWASLMQTLTGSYNTAVGHSAGLFDNTGSYNSYFGVDAYNNRTGNYNTHIGASAGGVNTTGSYNTALGASSGSETGSVNLQRSTALGYNATVACDDCMTLGPDADSAGGGTPLKIGIGIRSPRQALDVSGDANVTGFLALGGAKTGATGRLGSAKLSVDGQVAITDNNALYWAANPNTRIVYDSGTGYFTQQAFGGHYFNSYDGGYVTQFTIGDNGALTARSLTGTGSRAVMADASGVLSAPTSDARAKENIRPLAASLDVLSLLKKDEIHAVYYNWKDKSKGEKPEVGFTAQMFEHSVPEITGTDNKGNLYLDYQKIAAILWEQNRKLLERIEVLEKTAILLPNGGRNSFINVDANN